MLRPQVYAERCVACLSSTSDPCACRMWPEVATPTPPSRSFATCGRSNLCFLGAQESGRILPSTRRTWAGASGLPPHTHNSATGRSTSEIARGARSRWRNHLPPRKIGLWTTSVNEKVRPITASGGEKYAKPSVCTVSYTHLTLPTKA